MARDQGVRCGEDPGADCGHIWRFNRTLATEWAYARTWYSDQQRTDALTDWIHQYNRHRPTQTQRRTGLVLHLGEGVKIGYHEGMSIRSRLRHLMRRGSDDLSSSKYAEDLTRASQRLAEKRGDRITAMPADHKPSSIENVQSAAKDYGLSRFSGETDALGDAADAYRSSSKRKK